ncbi:hypothetical protein BH10PAT4_BH10PAT4_4390 [soil metagenome]
MRGSKQHSPKATTLIDHIRELQKRLLISFVVLIAAGVLVYFVYEPLLNLLRSPLGAPLFYSNPAGSFAFIMKVCFMGALALTIPVIVFNLIMFIRPAFTKPIPKRKVVAASALSAFLAFSGAAFGFYYIVPGALHFFAGFQVTGLNAIISADSYLSFVTNVIITFVLVFQLPLLIAFIDRIKPIKPSTLLRGEKWAILGGLSVSVLVPFAFDLVTSLLIALPIIALYNVSILIIVIQHAMARRRENVLHSRFDPNTIPASSLALEALSFEDLVGTEQAAITLAANQPTVVPARSVSRPGMDIRRSTTPPSSVQPAEWVHRVHDPIPLNSRMRMVTDIRPRVSA